jgi:hypothetical protein
MLVLRSVANSEFLPSLRHQQICSDEAPFQGLRSQHRFLYSGWLPSNSVRQFIRLENIFWVEMVFLFHHNMGGYLHSFVCLLLSTDIPRKARQRAYHGLSQALDYIGTALFIAGVVLFRMGISWGGVLYPWKSALVIRRIKQPEHKIGHSGFEV